MLTIISSRSVSASDRALVKFAETLGIGTQVFLLEPQQTTAPVTATAPTPVLAFASKVWRDFAGRGWFERWLEEAAFVLVYDFPRSTDDCSALTALTRGALVSIVAVPPGRKTFAVHSGVRFSDFPVSGKQYVTECESQLVFNETPSRDIETYISVDGQPMFASVTRGKTYFFLLADSQIVDVDTSLRSQAFMRTWYANLIAITIFLRSALGSACWTSPRLGATLIIDDASLKSRHGFVEYKYLIPQAQTIGAALTIGFIPFNYRRSDPTTVRLWLHHAERASVAVHGCDHTAEEFANIDADWLLGSTACALDRMETHQRITGIPFDRVMIFPHERFSTSAMRALRAHGFTAAVCESLQPVDAGLGSLTVRDLLLPAVMRYEDFPLFVRRRASDSFDFAFDALLQKPILGFEHHSWFRHGYRKFASFVHNVSALTTSVEWMSLGRAIESTCTFKQVRGSRYIVRHYARSFRFRNPMPDEVRLLVEMPAMGQDVEAVLVGENRTAFGIEGGWLRYELQVAAGEDVRAEVVYRRAHRMTRTLSRRYRITTRMRRMLCDVRDNYLERSELFSLALRASTILRRRHDSPEVGHRDPHSSERFCSEE